ncbi:MAG: glycosyltransferase family 2 protein [Alicyclobacillus sp.]|nr:glycosyltransferase family 2 protein [Alicyclobacillus sp.]
MLTVVVLTKNEESNIVEFIKNHNFADEILVIDSYSSDRTVALAQSYGARVELVRWMGFPKQWNYGLQLARGEWILIADADHRCSEELVKELLNVVNDKTLSPVAYYIPRRNYVLGRWIKHCGWYPDYPYPRLVKKGHGEFIVGRQVHEKLQVVGGSIGYLKGHVNHYTYDSVDQFVDKLQRYTSLEALERYNSEIRWFPRLREVMNSDLPWRAKKGLLRPLLPFRPIIRFVYMYFLRQGFRDGWQGLLVCLMSAFYEILVNFKAKELRVARK